MKRARILALLLSLTTAVFFVACDSPRENATEEKIEDAGDKNGSEDAAEERGEAVSEGEATDTSATTTTTSTATGTTATSGT